MPAHWIDKLNADNGRLHKEGVIGKAVTAFKLGDTNAEVFLRCASLAYNKYITFNIRRVPETMGITNQPNDWDKLFVLLDQLHNRSVTGNVALSQVEKLSKEFDSHQWNKLARPTLLRDLSVGASQTTFNKFLKGTEYEIPSFNVQLATDYKKKPKNMVGEKILQPKLDGVRAVAIIHNDGIDLLTRSGKELHNFDKITNYLSTTFKNSAAKFQRFGIGTIDGEMTGKLIEPIVLDGEIMSDTFQNLMTQVQRKSDIDTDDCVYNVFDIMSFTEFMNGYSYHSLYDRIATLSIVKLQLFDGECVNLMTDALYVDLDTDDGQKEMTEYFDLCIADGYEGIMIKDPNAMYECKRSASWLKMKPIIEMDMTIIGFEEGTKKNKGKLGAFICTCIDDGREIVVNVGGGYSDKQREEFWEHQGELLGHIVEVHADAVTKSRNKKSNVHSLRFSRFMRFRDIDAGIKI